MATALEELREWRATQGERPVKAPIASQCETAEKPRQKGQKVTKASADFHRPASTVLRLVTQSDVPQSHTALTRTLQEAGHTKEAAREAIAEAQGRGWIEHDLKLGYVLAGAAEGGEECNG